MLSNEALLEIRDLCVEFYTDSGTVPAVDGVSFAVPSQGALGIVGESGCGKSVTARAVMRLVKPPMAKVTGSIRYHPSGGAPVELLELPPTGRAIRRIRGKEIAMIFQEPMASLNPSYTVGNQMVETMRLHDGLSRREAADRAIAMLDRVGISVPRQRFDQYPHQLSGGMRQRVMIAMALSCNPRLLIADEPTTALDVTVQAQILELIQELQQSSAMAVVMITHDLGVIVETSRRVVVMYLGEVVEYASVDTIFYGARHPYTQGLLRSIPSVYDAGDRPLEPIRGTVPSPRDRPRGCCFATRCPAATEVCFAEKPPVVTEEDAGGRHDVKCWLYV